MGRKSRTIIRLTLYTSAFLLVVLSILIALTIQTAPLVPEIAPMASEDAIAGTEALRRTKRMLANTGKTQNYTATLVEIDSILKLANKRFPQLRGNANIQGNTLLLQGTLKLPIGNSFYLNAQTVIKEGERFSWSESRIGNLPIADTLANTLFKALGSRFIQSQFSSWVNDGVRSVKVSNAGINIEAKLPADLPGHMQNTIGVLGGISNKEQEKLSKQARYYLDQIERSRKNLTTGKNSLSTYLNVLSSSVLKRVQNEGADFKEEVNASIFSLAYAMVPSLMSPFLPELNHSLRLPNLELDGRSDFAAHFILSAVLEILSNKDLAFTIGELKELQDANGGSGYSLRDIAADRAGIYFIQAISSQEIVAQRFVNPNYVLMDTDYFPDVSWLEEGMTDREFKTKFTSTQSREYLNLINQIDRLISMRPLYK